jgi:hypothetical protein
MATDLHPALRSVVDEAWPLVTVAVRIGVIPRPPRWPAAAVTLLGDAIRLAPGFGGNLAMRDAQRLRDALVRAATGEQGLLTAIGEYEDALRRDGFPAADAVGPDRDPNHHHREGERMSLAVLTQNSLSLFDAVGGWRTVAEAVASRMVFLLAYLLTDRVPVSALIAAGAVAVLAVVRVCTQRAYWSAAIGLLVVGFSALLAGSTGRAVDFYLSAVLLSPARAVLFLVSMAVGWPVVGLAVGAVRGERFAWRRDPVRRRQYQICTAFFVLKSAIATAVLVPLYLTEQVVALGITATLVGGAPAMGLCVHLSWRVLRTRAEPAIRPRP